MPRKKKVSVVEKKMIECPFCKSRIEENSPFCSVCGAQIPEKSFCIQCGTEKYYGLNCPTCGYNELKKKSKKGFVITMSIIGTLILAGLIVLIILLVGGSSKESKHDDPNDPTNSGPVIVNKETVKIKDSETKAIQYDTVSNNVFSMKIPKGWKVEVMGDNIHYGIRAYNPNDQRYQIFMYLKMEPFLTSQSAKNIWGNLYAHSGGDTGYAIFANSTVLKGYSTAGFYDSFMEHVGFAKSNYGSSFYLNASKHTFPVMYNIEQLDNIAPKVSGGGQFEGILRLNFTVPLATGEELKGQGLFTASVMPANSVQKISGVDVTPRLVYEVSGVSSAEDDFTSWEPILLDCLRSLKYTDAFVSATQQASIAAGEAARDANAKIQAAYDSYNNAWSKRQTTYDVASQKRSDATLSYDRVKDPDTGEIYRAEVGWYDSYNTNREKYNKTNLQLVTSDSDYLEPVSGYIYK